MIKERMPARGRNRNGAADPEEGLRSLFDRVASLNSTNSRSALKLAASAYERAHAAGDRHYMARALYEKSRAHLFLGDFRSAMGTLSEAIDICRDAGDDDHIMMLTAAKGEVYNQLGEYVKALELLFEAVELAERRERRADLPMFYTGIANIYYTTGDYVKSVDFLLRSLELYDEQAGLRTAANGTGAMDDVERDRAQSVQIECSRERQRAIILCNIGNAYGNLPRSRSKEMGYYREALAIYRRIGDRRGECSVLGNIGTGLAARGKHADALRHQLEALAISEALDNDIQTAILYSQLGMTYQQMESFAESIGYFERALEIFGRLEQRRFEYDLHRMLAESYERSGELARAFEHQKRYITLKEEVLGHEKQRKIAEIQMRLDIERSEREKERLLAQTTMLREELALKNRQLTATALRLVEKNELLDNLQKQIRELLAESNADRRKGRALVAEIQQNRRAEDSWNQFKKEFEHVHPDFMRALSQRYPALTPTELKICALLKINLGTKEIAQLLCIAPRSVDMNRYRIRKKLGLPYEVNLTSFLATI
jgi:tetratricopeptide (TPR) repeat protein